MGEVIPFDGLVWCDVADDWVPACWCGPHKQCPEHYLNCVIDKEEDEAEEDEPTDERDRVIAQLQGRVKERDRIIAQLQDTLTKERSRSRGD